jgi:cyclopropane-fatty-acyl-phospholipid synthase
MGTTPHDYESDKGGIWIDQPAGHSNCYSDPEGGFSVVAAGYEDVNRYIHRDTYSAAVAFVQGKFDIRGDIFAAIRYFLKQGHTGLRQFLFSALAKLEHLRINSFLTGDEAKENIQFHYDRSNEFYKQFLDSRMIYSAAHFESVSDSLDKAQTRKLERICKDLALRPEERFLDMGCGWGALICYAAEHFGSRAYGCTLSEQQLKFARQAIHQKGLEAVVSANICDYRKLNGRFDKIASVGMFEHVGHARLAGYFQKIYSLLSPGGLFLNRGIVRPQGVSDGPDTLFLQKRVFPGGDLVHLDTVVREGERAGFEVVGLRELRTHYALTCRRWVENLRRNASQCRALVGETTYRTWLLYLAASAVSFEDGHTAATQVLFSKRRSALT